MLTEGLFKFAEFELDAEKRLLRKNGDQLPLYSKSFDLLLALIERRGEILSKDELLEAVWPGQFVEEQNLTVQIHNLRKIFGEPKDEHSFIVTVPGRGYRFVADVIAVDNPELTVETHRVSELIVKEDVLVPPPRTSRRAVFVVALLGLIGIAVLGYWVLFRQSGDPIESVSVMPFVNEGGREDLEYLSDGLTESLINDLSRLEGLSVKARSTVFHYKGKNFSPVDVGKELNVESVVLGRLVEHDGLITLYVSLVNAKTGDQIWGKEYGKNINDAALLHGEVVRDVSHNLRARLTASDEQLISGTYIPSTEAYLLYAKGRFYWNRRTAKDLRKAVEYFEQATQLDPNYARAYAGLADAYSLLPNFGGGPAIEFKPKAMTAALKALALDDSLAEAHASLGAILGDFNFDFVGEEREYKRAIELSPNYATAHHWYADMLTRSGRHDEAEREYRIALALDPLSLPIARNYAESLMLAGKYDRSIAEATKIVEFDPSFVHAYETLANAYYATGNHEGCVEGFAKVEELIGEPRFAAQMRESFARGGWNEFLSEMTGERRPANLPSYVVAIFATARGDLDTAFANLERSFETRDGFILYIKVDPRLDPLRGDPRFANLMQRVGYE